MCARRATCWPRYRSRWTAPTCLWPRPRLPIYCVGFAAESHDLLAHASAKRARKGVPLLVGNIGPATFGKDDNALLLVDAQGASEMPHASKRVLARKLIAEIDRRTLGWVHKK